MRGRRKQSIFLICVAILLVAVGVFFLLRDNEELYSQNYSESGQEDTVLYSGKEYRYNDHLSNYLFMGIDTREPITEYETREDAGRADTIFLLSYDRVEQTLQCIAIPRDTMANIRVIAVDGTDLGTSKEHLTLQYAFGDGKQESCNLMKEAVSALLYDLPIEGYCSLNMDGIPIAVDVLGGVELTVPDNTLQAVNPEFTEGALVTITKDNAEQFVRYRDINIAQSAIDRMNRQKVFIKAAAERAKEKAAEDTGFVVDIYESIKPYMVTSMGTDVFAKLLQASFDSEKGFQDIPGEKIAGDVYDEYHVDETQLYEMILRIFYKEV